MEEAKDEGLGAEGAVGGPTAVGAPWVRELSSGTTNARSGVYEEVERGDDFAVVVGGEAR